MEPDATETKTARRKRLKAERQADAAEAERRRLAQQMERQRNRLRQRVCSAAWLDAMVAGGERVTVKRHLPVPTDDWQPCGCARCRRNRHMGWPSIYMTSSGHSYECYVESLLRPLDDEPEPEPRRMDEATAVMMGLTITATPNQATQYRRRK